MSGLGATEQEQRSAGDRAFNGQFGPVEKGGIRPRRDFLLGKSVGVFAGEGLASLGDGFGVKVVQMGGGQNLGAPIGSETLGADGILLVQGEAGEALAGSGVIMGMPSNRDAERSRRDFKQNHPAVSVREFMDFPEGDGRLGSLGNLVLEAVQVLSRHPVIAADDLPRGIIVG